MTMNRQNFLLIIASVALLAYPALLALLSITHHITQLAPHDPWESAEVIEGWRLRQGLPLYEDKVVGHSTLMYTPGEPWLLGWLFRLCGPSLFAVRLLSLIGSLSLIAGIWLVLRPYLRGIVHLLMALGFLAIDTRVNYAVEGRPDYLAWPLGLAGLACAYRGSQSGWRWSLLGAVLIGAGVLFKQPVACLAPVPLLWLLVFGRHQWSFKNAAISALPLIVFAALMLSLKGFWPAVFHEAVTVPKGYSVSVKLFSNELWSFVADAAALWMGLVAWLLGMRIDDDEWRKRTQWAAVCCSLTIPASALAAAKVGGTSNSFIPAWFSLLTLCWLLLAPFIDTIRTGVSNRPIRLFIASLAFLLTVLPGPALNTYFLHYWHGRDASYREVIAKASAFPGRVVCPEDPLLILKAKGEIGRNIFVEYDSRWWPTEMPPELKADIGQADYVVDCVNWFQDLLKPAQLTSQGFTQVWSNENFTVWKASPSKP